MARKRQLKEVEHLSEVLEPIASASLHAAILSVSPVKKGKSTSFFDGRLTDGVDQLRVVGFSAQQQKQLTALKDDKRSIKLDNCEIKQSRQGNKMEVILKNTTKISESPKKINVPDQTDELPVVTDVAQLPYISNFQKVAVDIKVLDVAEPMTVTGGKRKQEVTIGDRTGVARVTLWEQHIGALEDESCYTLKNFVVREYAAVKYLSMPREGWSIIPIGDIGDVEQTDSDVVEQQKMEIFDAVIIGVPYLDSYKACIRCKARVEPQTPPLGHCSKDDCSMMQQFDLCKPQLTAKIMFMHGADKNVDTLHAFWKIVDELASNSQDGKVTSESLLRAPRLSKVMFNDKKVITGFSQQ